MLRFIRHSFAFDTVFQILVKAIDKKSIVLEFLLNAIYSIGKSTCFKVVSTPLFYFIVI